MDGRKRVFIYSGRGFGVGCKVLWGSGLRRCHLMDGVFGWGGRWKCFWGRGFVLIPSQRRKSLVFRGLGGVVTLVIRANLFLHGKRNRHADSGALTRLSRLLGEAKKMGPGLCAFGDGPRLDSASRQPAAATAGLRPQSIPKKGSDGWPISRNWAGCGGWGCGRSSWAGRRFWPSRRRG